MTASVQPPSPSADQEPAPTARARPWSMGRLAPLVLIAALVADVGSRFLSYDHVTFRAWEAVMRGGPSGLGCPFTPSARYVNQRSSGDLASRGNVPDMRQFRTEVFTTDEIGCRNPPRAPSTRFRVVLVGTSFTVGSSVSDEQTLAAQLERRLGAPVYNAAGLNLGDERQLRLLETHVALADAIVVSEFVDNKPPPTASEVHRTDAPRRLDARLGRHADDLRRARHVFSAFLAESPLKLAVYKRFKALQDDVVLPNGFASLVQRERLANGDEILFESSTVERRHTLADADDAVRYWRGLDDLLRAHGVRLLVALVPSQYHVYGPLTESPHDVSGPTQFLARMAGELDQASIPAVNLEEPLTAAARKSLPSRHEIYWRDDTHWNADGIAVAADALAARLGPLLRGR